MDRSLLQRRKGGRYELHELLRQFVDQETADQSRETARRHSDDYLNLVAVQERAFYGPPPHQAVAAVQPNLSNLRQAWQWAIEQQYWPAVERSLEGLGRFYRITALLQEGEAMFAQAIAGFGGAPRLQVWRAYFLFKLGQTAEAIQLAEQALQQSRSDDAARRGPQFGRSGR